jgi:poly(3-hydroxybutyrate) depolymerase
VQALAGCVQSEAAPDLPRLTVDTQRVAVAGISSGAIMAQQTHLAYSDRLRGAVLLAGPPYQCARGSLDVALSRCLKHEGPALDVAGLSRSIVERASSGALASLQGLEGDRVLALHGRKDAVVPEAAARAALAVYEQLPNAATMSLQWDGDGDFAHVWPTMDRGGDCSATSAPYIGNCGRDLAAESMRALFGAPRREVAIEPAASLTTFAQSGFGPDGEDAYLGELGFLYRPPQCDAGTSCGLLVVFHGCEQNADEIGDRFARDAGFNRWADAFDVVVMYPQTRATYMPLNPKACWDWWGYSGSDYDTRKGVQLRAVAAMASALGAPLTD